MRPPKLGAMSAAEIDEYLRGLEEPKRAAFRVGGKTIAGFAALKNHLSYLPFSGSVLGQFADELDGYTTTKSSLHFPSIDRYRKRS
jgi:hypothetical protein